MFRLPYINYSQANVIAKLKEWLSYIKKYDDSRVDYEFPAGFCNGMANYYMMQQACEIHNRSYTEHQIDFPLQLQRVFRDFVALSTPQLKIMAHAKTTVEEALDYVLSNPEQWPTQAKSFSFRKRETRQRIILREFINMSRQPLNHDQLTKIFNELMQLKEKILQVFDNVDYLQRTWVRVPIEASPNAGEVLQHIASAEMPTLRLTHQELLVIEPGELKKIIELARTHPDLLFKVYNVGHAVAVHWRDGDYFNMNANSPHLVVDTDSKRKSTDELIAGLTNPEERVRNELCLFALQVYAVDVPPEHELKRANNEYEEKDDGFAKRTVDYHKHLLDVVEKRANFIYKDRMSVLVMLAYLGDVSSIKLILGASTPQGRLLVNVNQVVGPYRFTALSLAACYGHYEMAKLLLSYPGINVNVQDYKKMTPLHFAVARQDLRMVKILLQMQPNLRLCNQQGLTALALAKKLQNNDIASLVNAPHTLVVPEADHIVPGSLVRKTIAELQQRLEETADDRYGMDVAGILGALGRAGTSTVAAPPAATTEVAVQEPAQPMLLPAVTNTTAMPDVSQDQGDDSDPHRIFEPR